MVWLILILVLIFSFGWILFSPVILNIDTARAEYQLYQPGTIRFWLAADFKPHLSLFGISIPMKKRNKNETKQKSKKQHSKRSVSLHKLQALLQRIFHSITIKRFCLDVDTDDVVMNAQMVPVFTFLSRGPIHLTSNFEGRVCASLQAEIKLYRMGWAFLLFFTKK